MKVCGILFQSDAILEMTIHQVYVSFILNELSRTPLKYLGHHGQPTRPTVKQKRGIGCTRELQQA